LILLRFSGAKNGGSDVLTIQSERENNSMENLNSSFGENRKIQYREYPATFRPNNKKHIGRGKGTFVDRDLFESPAFFALGGVAPQMLIYFLGKRNFENTKKGRICTNAKELKLSYIELAELGISQPRGTRGFNELLAKGFLKIEHHGGGCQKDMSVYSLSNQYELWRKGLVIATRPKSVRKGFMDKARQFQHTKA